MGGWADGARLWRQRCPQLPMLNPLVWGLLPPKSLSTRDSAAATQLPLLREGLLEEGCGGDRRDAMGTVTLAVEGCEGGSSGGLNPLQWGCVPNRACSKGLFSFSTPHFLLALTKQANCCYGVCSLLSKCCSPSC